MSRARACNFCPGTCSSRRLRRARRRRMVILSSLGQPVADAWAGAREPARPGGKHIMARQDPTTGRAAYESAILEVSPDSVVSMDERGLVTEFNPAAEKTFGYSRAEAIGTPLADL